jgi:hypothetical protein
MSENRTWRGVSYDADLFIGEMGLGNVVLLFERGCWQKLREVEEVSGKPAKTLELLKQCVENVVENRMPSAETCVVTQKQLVALLGEEKGQALHSAMVDHVENLKLLTASTVDVKPEPSARGSVKRPLEEEEPVLPEPHNRVTRQNVALKKIRDDIAQVRFWVLQAKRI